ncbi:MAG: hypothetical protein ABL888_15370, partial [Pirellulaceae bacterium]
MALQQGLLFTVKELTVIAIIGAAVVVPLSFIIAPIISRSNISQIKKKLTDAEKKDGDLIQLNATKGAIHLLTRVGFFGRFCGFELLEGLKCHEQLERKCLIQRRFA